MNRTERLAQFIATAAARQLDDDIAELGRLHVLDTLAAIVACGGLDAAQVARRFAGPLRCRRDRHGAGGDDARLTPARPDRRCSLRRGDDRTSRGGAQ